MEVSMQKISFLLLVFAIFSVYGAPNKKSWTAAELQKESQKQNQWRNNKIGCSGGLMKPWTPMQVKNDSVLCWGRSYVYNKTLLPSQINSSNESLLASPIHFDMQIAGQKHKVSIADVKIHKIDDENIQVDSVSIVKGVRFRMLTKYEFDGMSKINLTIEPVSKPVVIDSLDLVFPLQEKKSNLFHYIFMGEAGRPPQTNAGKTPINGFSLNEFRGLLWFGNDQIGLCWFAEGVKNWPLKDEKGIQSISKVKNGVREFRIKFGNRQFKLDKMLELEFGIQATPTKPRDPDFRRKSDRSTLVWRWCWGDGYYYPFAEDYTAARADVKAARAKGKEVMPCSSLYFYGMFRFYANPFGKLANPGLLHRELKLWGPKWSRNTSDGKTRFKPWRTLPGGKIEWDITSPTDLAPGKWYGKVNNPQALVKLCLNSEYQDYYLFRFEEMVRKTGLKCIYLDGTIGVCLNQAHGCGYIDYTGKLRGSAPIFAMRNMMKRVRRVLYAKHGESRICMHESGRISIPVLSMADTFLDGENYAAGPLAVEEFYSKLLTKDRLLAEHTGIQFGFFPEFLPELTVSWRDKKAPTPASTRDLLGLMFIHDNNVSPQGTFHAKMISFMQKIRLSYFPECDQVRYYWRPDNSISIAPKAVHHILHFGKKRGLLILFNWSDDVHNAKVKCNWNKIFPGKQLSVVTDAVTGEKFSVSNGQFTIPLAPRDFRMIDMSVNKMEK
jgi:hypothetical protein